MNDMMLEAEQAVKSPEVQEMLRKLSKYGLGVFVPHMHTESEPFVPLPADTIQLERGLHVSFCKRSDVDAENSVTTGWIWNEGTQSAMECSKCQGNHHIR